MHSRIDEALLRQLPHCLNRTDLTGIGELYRGKVRDVYRRGDRLVLVTTDRLSAFDHILTTLPFKGEILNRLTNFWFEKTRDLVPNHIVDVPHPNVTVAKRCEAYKVEFIVRGHLTGSLWRDYASGTRESYGIRFPDGLRKDQSFERPILTPSTKADLGDHDTPISPEDIVASGRMSRAEWERASEAALSLFETGRRWAAQRGLIMVDTKYEFGVANGKLHVIDEIHTPDCTRYWYADEYEARFQRGEDQRMLDKENLRQWLIRERGFSGQGTPPAIPDEVRVDLAKKYVSAYEQLTGLELNLQPGDVTQAIVAAAAQLR